MSPRAYFRHSLPLLLLTTLVVIAAGLAIAAAAVGWLLPNPRAQQLPLLLAAFMLTALGGGISLLHLGRKARAGRAALALEHSWLSREAVLIGVFATSTLTAVLVSSLGWPVLWLTIASSTAALSGLLTTIAIGKLYDLGAQLGWRGLAHVLTPPVSALLLASAVLGMAIGGTHQTVIFSLLWLADLELVRRRNRALDRICDQASAYPKLIRAVKWAYRLRYLLSVAAIICYPVSARPARAVVIAVAICLDRFCFYAGAAQRSPAHEIAKLRDERLQQACC